MKKESLKVIPKGVTDITMACFDKGTTIREEILKGTKVVPFEWKTLLKKEQQTL